MSTNPNPEPLKIIPTWVGCLPILIAALIDGTPEGKQMAREELLRMARIADVAVDQQRT